MSGEECEHNFNDFVDARAKEAVVRHSEDLEIAESNRVRQVRKALGVLAEGMGAVLDPDFEARKGCSRRQGQEGTGEARVGVV